MVRVVVAGAGGKMGRNIAVAAHNTQGVELAGGTEMEGSGLIGRDIGELAGIGPIGKTVLADFRAAMQKGNADMAIDFTAPEATIRHLAAAVELKKGMVIGTTGMEKSHQEEIKRASEKIPIVFAPNMSVGINLMLRLVCEAANALGEEYDIEIIEAHHRLKKDAPSGTAMKLAEELARATNKNLDEAGVFARKGMIGARKRGEIGIQTIRAGDIIGDHTVLFGGLGERIEITHRASSRETFALGAVRAALWLEGRAPGLYSMMNVLGFSS
ncbi:MAG: 4-hydroxy-tetrahydrodipicolinate reductase [Nitrospinae bacterium]|nr:4-hydroxy-tetrahydrodipicolinate reductase [Nitrospinota bacterium]